MKKTFSMTNTFSADAMNAPVNFSCANIVNDAAMAISAIALFVLSVIRIIIPVLIIKSEYSSKLQTA